MESELSFANYSASRQTNVFLSILVTWLYCCHLNNFLSIGHNKVYVKLLKTIFENPSSGKWIDLDNSKPLSFCFDLYVYNLASRQK